MKTIKYTLVFLSFLVSEIGFAQNIKWKDLFEIHDADFGAFRDARIAKSFFEREPSKPNSWKRTMQGNINGRPGEWDEMIVVYPNEQDKITFISYNADDFLKLLTLLKDKSGENAKPLPSITTAKGTVINRFVKDKRTIEVTSAYDENIQIWICSLTKLQDDKDIEDEDKTEKNKVVDNKINKEKNNKNTETKSTEGKRIALCIGNSEYEHGSKLKEVPLHDAEDMAKRLEDLGFQVISATNTSLDALKKVINQFRNEIKGAEISLFFYAGHGLEINGKKYILPVDINLQQSSDVLDGAYEIEDVLFAKLKESGANNNLIILDACRNDPFKDWDKDTRDIVNRAFTPMKAPKTSKNAYLAMATGWGNVAQQSSKRNGFYTEALLKNLNKGETIDQVFDKTGILVKKLTGNSQNPQFLKELSIESNFVF